MIQKQKINDSNDLWIFKSNTKYLCVERILQVYVFYSSWPLPIHTILRNRILNAYFWHLSPNAMWSAGLIIPIHRLVDRVLDLYGPLPILNTLCTAAPLKQGSRGSIIAQFHSTGEFFIRVSLRSEPQEQGGKEPLGPLGPLGLVKKHLVRRAASKKGSSTKSLQRGNYATYSFRWRWLVKYGSDPEDKINCIQFPLTTVWQSRHSGCPRPTIALNPSIYPRRCYTHEFHHCSISHWKLKRWQQLILSNVYSSPEKMDIQAYFHTYAYFACNVKFIYLFSFSLNFPLTDWVVLLAATSNLTWLPMMLVVTFLPGCTWGDTITYNYIGGYKKSVFIIVTCEHLADVESLSFHFLV